MQTNKIESYKEYEVLVSMFSNRTKLVKINEWFERRTEYQSMFKGPYEECKVFRFRLRASFAKLNGVA